MVEKPPELVEAEVVEMLCQRYHITPDRARRLDASVLRHVAILELARSEAPPLERRPLEQEGVHAGLAALSMALGVGGDGV